MRFNTAVSQLMITVNELEKQEKISAKDYSLLLQLVAPFAPHAAEELWEALGNKESIHRSSWPSFDESKLQDDSVSIAIQVNGKTREVLSLSSDVSEEEVKAAAAALPGIQKWIAGKEFKRVIYVKNRILNLIVDSE